MDGEPVFVCQNLNAILHTPVLTVKPFVYKELTMTLRALEGQRFVRKTQLAPGEYRKNFHQIDREILTAVTSAEADAVTPLMSKIYLRLVNAPERFWEREGVLRIEAEAREEKVVKAWTVLCDLVGVSSATASKALRWMHEQGIIGYFSGKNGVGLRIFLNRAASSIGVRQRQGGEKILAFPPASSANEVTSLNEPAFNVPFGDLESSDTDNKSRAPKNGADATPLVKNSPNQAGHTPTARIPGMPRSEVLSQITNVFSLEYAVTRLRAELEPAMQAAARQAAAREHERTREWLESKGLPKAARVAQRETYDVLRKYGVIEGTSHPSRSQAEVGRSTCAATGPRLISDDEVNELAQACLAMFETQGRPVEVTLSEMGSGAGGFLLPEDAQRVQEKANSLFTAVNKRGE
ncbi:MAG TPA: hypothetical protein VF659_09905 [Pyrinomonadaceae bacterium]